jgi:hypothetical protein
MPQTTQSHCDNNNPVVQTQDAKYLRMYLDGKFTWRSHVEKTVECLYVIELFSACLFDGTVRYSGCMGRTSI